MKIGAILFTVREHCSTIEGLNETFSKLKAIGYDVVQVSGVNLEIVTPDAIAAALEKHGLECAITHMPWPRFLNDIDNVIKEHKQWNCKHAAIGVLPPEEDYYTTKGLEKFVKELQTVVPQLNQAGIDFSYHNHDRELAKFDGLGGMTWLEALYEWADEKLLKAELDVHWLTRGGAEPSTWVKRYAHRMPALHCKDMSLKMPEREARFAAVGDGNLNWPAIFEAAKGKVDYLIVEQDTCYDEDCFDCLKRSFDFIKANI